MFPQIHENSMPEQHVPHRRPRGIKTVKDVDAVDAVIIGRQKGIPIQYITILDKGYKNGVKIVSAG